MTVKRDVTSVESFCGHYLDYLDPRPECIELDDIARGLALTHRFGSQINKRYSVAEHAVYVRELVIEWGHPGLAFAALHHDSHEAYLGDWPSPLKFVIESQAPGLLKKLARDIDVAICEKFGIDLDLLRHPVVKEADEYAMRREAATLKYSHGTGPHWGYAEALKPLAGIGWGEDRAEREFLKAHRTEMSLYISTADVLHHAA